MCGTKQCVAPSEELFTSKIPLLSFRGSVGVRLLGESTLTEMMKMCKKMPVVCQENRKAWLEKQNLIIKQNWVTPEPSLLGSSLFSNNLSLNSLSDNNCGEFSFRRGKISPSLILFENMTPDIKEEDKKILRLMAERREAAIREEEMAHSVRAIWAEEKKQYSKIMEERKKQWNEYIAHKRKLENLKNCLRRKNQVDLAKEEKMLLESKIKEKYDRSDRIKRKISDQKGDDTANSIREMMHRHLLRQREHEEDVHNWLKLKYYEDKIRRADEKLKFILTEKMRRIKEASLKRDMKWLAAKELRDEMRRKSEEICRENARREEICHTIREYAVSNGIERKKKMAAERNQTKKEYHQLIYNKLKEEERERERQARLYLQAKEARMKAIKEKKDSSISRSRSSSRMAANLRQKIKSSYNF